MPTDLDSFAQVLSKADSLTLTAEQTRLFKTVLAQLATSQSLIARQQALLESYASDTADIEAAIANSLDAARSSLDTHSPLTSYNAHAARAARTELLKQLDNAASLDAWLATILRFVAAITLTANL